MSDFKIQYVANLARLALSPDAVSYTHLRAHET